MPEFLNPFSGTVPDRKLTDAELVRAIRLNVAAAVTAVLHLLYYLRLAGRGRR